MNINPERWYVVVLDDRREFALHVWRYLNRSLGIGTEPLSESGEFWMPEQRVIPFLDGVNRFCWLHADGHCEEKLKPFLEIVEEGWNLQAIIDVVGESGSGYNPERLLSLLKDNKGSHPGKICYWLVSAYHIGARIEDEIEVLPKSRTTLNQIRQQVYGNVHRRVDESLNASHILITGAGFEIKDYRGGFGMLSTSELLLRMMDPFCLKEPGQRTEDREIVYMEPSSGGFPCPTGKNWDSVVSIKNAAAERKLDLFWDILLAKELSVRLGEIVNMEANKREETTANALISERRMREAFRRSIREHDWGHTNQSLAAAGLPWHAWFTTNYTRFSDRAIALIDPLKWRIISTAAEANISIREDNWALENPESGGRQYRYLFKLHGDVGHLHTMAIAGHDKDPFSPLSVPVDDLYQVYASAERFLQYSLRNLNGPVVWHIVGHALGDSRLVSMVRRACEQIKGKHLFLIVDLYPDTPRRNLERALGKKKAPGFKSKTKQLLAEEYMARLARSGLPPSADRSALIQWFESLPSGEMDLKGRVRRGRLDVNGRSDRG